MANQNDAGTAIIQTVVDGIGRINAAMQTQQVHDATNELVTLLGAANQYFADQAPWGLKADLPRMGTILATTADVVRRAAIAAQPFIPASAGKFLDMLAVPAEQRMLMDALSDRMVAGVTLPPPEPVFKKFEQVKAG